MAEDPERGHPHQRAVRLAPPERAIEQRGPHGGADVERARAEPGPVGLTDDLALEAPARHEGSRERERQLGVVRGLPSQDLPVATVPQSSWALAFHARDRPGVLELDEPSQVVAGELAE